MATYPVFDPQEASNADMRIRTLDAQMIGAKERKVLRKIILHLKEMPQLWYSRHHDFGKLVVKDLCTLLKVYREYDPHATVCTIKRKLDTLFKTYKAECQRIAAARRKYPDEPHKHVSTLWHYKDVSLMASSVKQQQSALDYIWRPSLFRDQPAAPSQDVAARAAKAALTLSMAGTTLVFSSSTASVSDNSTQKQADSTRVTPRKSTSIRVSHRSDNVPNVYLRRKVNAVYEPEGVREKRQIDEVEMFVESQLREANEEQKKLALKLISETLREAGLGQLTENSSIQLRTQEKD